MMNLLVASVVLAAAPVQAPVGPVATLDHVALHVADLGRSVAFYKAVFDLRERPAPFATARWLMLANGTALHLVAGRTAPVNLERWDHIAIACADMDAMIARLSANAIPWTDITGAPRPQIRPDGVKQIFIRDPDGYWIEINDALKPRPPR